MSAMSDSIPEIYRYSRLVTHEDSDTYFINAYIQDIESPEQDTNPDVGNTMDDQNFNSSQLEAI